MKTAVAIAAVALLVESAYAAPSADGCVRGWCPTVEDAPSTQVHHILIAVKQKNVDLLIKTLYAVSDPDSPSYGRHLSLDEVTEMVAEPKHTATVMDWARRVSSRYVQATKTGEFVHVTAPVSVLESLFAADFRLYEHPDTSDRSVRLVRAASPVVPADVTDATDFMMGLNDFPSVAEIESTHFGRIASKGTPEAPLDDAAVTPVSLASYYKITGALGTSTKNSQAVWETQNQYYTPSDLASFESTYNLPAQKVANVTGGNTPGEPGMEAQLDVQYIIGTGTGVPTTFWYENAGFFTPFTGIIGNWLSAMSEDSKAPLITSISYGVGESEIINTQNSTLARIATETAKLGVRGLSVFIASGDSGVAGRGANTNPSACGFDPSWPASIPFVTSVGATQWVGGSPASGETTCSVQPISGTPAALITSGGGFSKTYYRQAYQDAAWKVWDTPAHGQPGQSTYEAKMRGIPDVSALGHHYQVMSGGSLEAVDGTSCSTPAFAGMIARINDRLLNAGKSPVGFANPVLYKLAASTPDAFNDITTGNNKCTEQVCCPNGYSAVTGWDPATGVGSPVFEKLSAAILAAAK